MKINNTKMFGEALKEKRKKLGYTQKYICDVSGISASYISDLENGKATAELGKAIYLANFFEIEIVSSPEFEGICAAYGITRGSLDTEAVVPIERFVTRMYRLSLERNAEQEGTYYWTFRLKEHMEN